MLSPLRHGLVAALLIGCHCVSAQTSVPATVTVQQLAPQLVAFAGSQVNFQNLVTGLAQGTPVHLFSVLADGSTQIVTFTPAAPVPVAQIPSLLESTRQQLIGENRPSPAVQTQSHVNPGVDAAAARVNTSDSRIAPGATSRTPVPTAPSAPGVAAHSAVPAGAGARGLER